MPLNDTYTELSPGSGGSKLDESLMTNDLAVQVRRTRILLSGDVNYNEIVRVVNTQTDGNEYALCVRPIIESPAGSMVFQDSNAISGNSIEATLADYTVPASNVFYFTGIIGTGDVPGKYNVYLDSTLLFSLRSTSSNPNVSQIFSTPPFQATAAQHIYIKVTNYVTGVTGNFDGTILGYTVPV